MERSSNKSMMTNNNTSSSTMNSSGKNSILHDDDDDNNNNNNNNVDDGNEKIIVKNLIDSELNVEQQQQLNIMIKQIVDDSVHDACMELLLEQQQQQSSSIDEESYDDEDAARKNNKKRNNHSNRNKQKSTTTTTLNNNNIDKIDPKIAESKKQQPSATTKTTSKESKSKNSTAAAAVDNEIKQELIIVDQTEEICNKESNIEPVATATAATVVDDKEKQQDLNSSNKCSTDNNDNKMNGVKSYGSNHMNGVCIGESTKCKICSKHVYHMEQIKAVKSIFHKSCFRCVECNKQLNMDSYSSHEGQIYCKPHFKQLFQPKPNFDNNNIISNGNCSNGIVDIDIIEQQQQQHSSRTSTLKSNDSCETSNIDDVNDLDQTTTNNIDEIDVDGKKSSSSSVTAKKYELIICENQPIELPPDVVRYNSKQQDVFENLTLDLSNIRNRFETGSVSKNNNNNHNHINNHYNDNKQPITRSESIHKIMKKYQSRVAGDNYVNSSSDEEDNQQQQQQQNNDNDHSNNETMNNNNDNDNLKEKMSFTGMSSLKSQWETGSITNRHDDNHQNVENELAELRRQKGKNSEPLTKIYERAIQEAKSQENLSAQQKSEQLLEMDVGCCSVRAGSIKEKFEKGAVDSTETEEDRIERLRKEREAEIIQIANNDRALKEARNKFKQIELGQSMDNISNNNNTNGHIESIDSKQLQQRFNYFENRNDSSISNGDHVDGDGEKQSSSQQQQQHSSVKIVDDIPKVDTTKKMLSKFKALEAGQSVNNNGDQSTTFSATNGSPKSPKRITPPRETLKVYENEPLVERDPNIVKSSYKTEDVIQVEPEKAKHLRAKFENWQTEIERENRKQDDENDFVPLERDTTKNLRAMFESIQNETNKPVDKPRPRVNRFVQEKTYQQQNDSCYVCSTRIYPMEKMEFSGIKLHKNCFRCAKCHMPMRLDNFTQHADKLFCIPHFKQLFMEKGNYDEGFGLEQHKDKWSNKTNGKSSSIATVATNGKSSNGHHHIDHDNEDQLDGGLNGSHNNNNTKTNGHNGNNNNLIDIDSDEQLDSSIEYHHQQQQDQLIEDY
ncbi:uncharacterized protein LOC113795052 isoform X4 [Dermatophagoides pteronyssinus]